MGSDRATFGFNGETSIELSSDDWASTPHRRIVHDYSPADGYGGCWGLEFIEIFLAAFLESATTEQWVTVETDSSRPASDQ